MFYRVAYAIVGLFVRLVYRITVTGLENVPAEGGAIIVANHLSYLDPPLVAVVLKRPIRFMAKGELFRFRVFAAVLRGLGAFPVNRVGVDRAAVREAINTVTSGQLLGIFPEGTRSKDGMLQRGHAGAALISIKTGVPVVPVGILGLGRKARGQGLRRQIRVAMGKPMLPLNQRVNSWIGVHWQRLLMI